MIIGIQHTVTQHASDIQWQVILAHTWSRYVRVTVLVLCTSLYCYTFPVPVTVCTWYILVRTVTDSEPPAVRTKYPVPSPVLPVMQFTGTGTPAIPDVLQDWPDDTNDRDSESRYRPCIGPGPPPAAAPRPGDQILIQIAFSSGRHGPLARPGRPRPITLRLRVSGTVAQPGGGTGVTPACRCGHRP